MNGDTKRTFSNFQANKIFLLLFVFQFVKTSGNVKAAHKSPCLSNIFLLSRRLYSCIVFLTRAQQSTQKETTPSFLCKHFSPIKSAETAPQCLPSGFDNGFRVRFSYNLKNCQVGSLHFNNRINFNFITFSILFP